MRYVRANYFASYKLSGIVIDSFVYAAIGSWKWLNPGESGSASWGDYENSLLSCFNHETLNGALSFTLKAPGSGDSVSTSKSLECLGTRVQTGYAEGTYPGTKAIIYPLKRVRLYPGTSPEMPYLLGFLGLS